MEVILRREVGKLGKIGEVVKVKNGYARNFLFPEKMACLATPANLKKIEREKVMQAAAYKKTKEEAEELAAKLSKVSCTVTVEVNDLEKLYGSVTEADIAKALELENVLIDKKDIVIEKPIEELGIFEIGINIHKEVTAKIRLWVAKK